MKLDFDTFEFTGLIAPGAVIVIALVLLYPQLLHLSDPAMTLTLALLGGYVFGHIVAAFGNLAEPLLQTLGVVNLESVPFGDWVARGYCSDAQLETLKQRVSDLRSGDISKVEARKAVVKQMYLTVVSSGRPHRVETFNGLCSLSRGFLVSFVGAAVLCLIAPQFAHQFWYAADCAAASALMFYRLRRFNESYSRELVQQFVFGPAGASPSAATPLKTSEPRAGAGKAVADSTPS